MLDIVYEFLFWVFFIGINAIAYSIIYVLHRDEKVSFWPYISSWKLNQKLGLLASGNLDSFRYCVEISVLWLFCRIWFHPILAFVATILYVFLLVFNLYQYTIRKIYHTEPILFNDLKLIKNAFVIVWSESKSKLIIAIPSILRSEEHTSELQSQSTISYAVFCLKKKKTKPLLHLLTQQVT